MRLLPSLLTSSTLAAAAFLRPPSLTARPWQWLHEPEEQHVFRTRPQSTADPASHGEIAFPHRPSRPVAGFVALGDSYSAGIGTGLNGTEDECRRGLHAHPRLIQADLNTTTRGHDAAPPALQFLSCTGSTIEDMLSGAPNSQIDAFNTSLPADFALLSIGGNDLGFFDIMNSCIFRFYSFYSGTCDEALRRSEEALTGPEFEHGLRLAIMEILDRVKWEKNPWFSIFVTGYARFFNADTNECDESSFGVWWRGPKLKRDLRQRMNRMVLRVNDKIRRSVDAINAGFTKPRVTFVDYDDAFEGHRFCERNTTEPDYGRNETWFFLVGGQDNSATNQSAALNAASAHAVLLSPSSPLIDPELCLGPAEKSGDWGELALCMMAMAAKEDPTLKTRHGDMVAENSMWYVPTYYGKTFHPRTLGHMAIRDRIYRLWEERQQNETQGKN